MKLLIEIPNGMYEELTVGKFPVQETNSLVDCIVNGVAVSHGKWIESDIPESALSKCSVCGFGCGAYTFRYCPKCGCRMDGKENRNDLP